MNVFAYATKFTREGVRDMTNRKPYRTKAQKIVAKQMAYDTPDGTIRSNAPVTYHRAEKGRM